MSEFKNIRIERNESWKYSNVLMQDDKTWAKVLVQDDGEIAPHSYTEAYHKKYGTKYYHEKYGNNDKPETKSNDKKGKDKSSKGNVAKKNESWLMKILLAPLRFLWWLIKMLFKLLWLVVKILLMIVSLGMLGSVLNPKDNA